jgi:hypothetical protein
MKIQIKTNITGIQAVNSILELLMSFDVNATDYDLKIMQSIGEDLSNKFTKSYKNCLQNQTLFDFKKMYSITLKYHEAATLGEMILTTINYVINVDEKTQLDKIKNFINQKLA